MLSKIKNKKLAITLLVAVFATIFTILIVNRNNQGDQSIPDVQVSDEKEILIRSEVLDINPLAEGYEVTFLYTLANINFSNILNLVATLDLDQALIGTVYTVEDLEAHNLIVNESFNGNSDTSLIEPNQTFPAKTQAQIWLTLKIVPNQNTGPFDIYIQAYGDLSGENDYEDNNNSDDDDNSDSEDGDNNSDETDPDGGDNDDGVGENDGDGNSDNNDGEDGSENPDGTENEDSDSDADETETVPFTSGTGFVSFGFSNSDDDDALIDFNASQDGSEEDTAGVGSGELENTNGGINFYWIIASNIFIVLLVGIFMARKKYEG